MNRVVSLACLGALLFVSLAVAPRAAHADPKKKVAVLGLELKDDGTGIDERSANIARLLTEALRRRARQPNGPFNLSAGSDKELVDAGLLAGCNTGEMSCMVKIGADLAADFLIFGKLEKLGKGFQVTLTLLDVINKNNVRTVSDKIPAGDTGDIALERWGKSLYGRLAGESNKGAVRVSANVDSGQVFIDGQPKANLVKGQARITGLEEGKVKLRVESDGSVKEQSVTINGGETTEVEVKLDAKKPDLGTGGTGPGTGGITGPGDGTTAGSGTGFTTSTEGTVSRGKPGGFWRKTAIASGVVALAAGGAWFFSAGKIDDANKALCLEGYDDNTTMLDANNNEVPTPTGIKGCGLNGSNTSVTGADAKDANDSGRLHEKLTWVEGTLTIAAGGLFVFSVVRGFIFPGKPSAEPPGTIVLHRHGRNKVTLTPVITPNGGAATVRFDW